MNTSGTKARAKRNVEHPHTICTCHILIYTGMSGFIFLLLGFCPQAMYKKLIAFASRVKLKPKAWEEWVTPQEYRSFPA